MSIKEIKNKTSAEGLRIGIVGARFNNFIVDALISGAVDTCLRFGANEKDVAIVRVPGAVEIPFACKLMAESKKFDCLVAVGAVIKGATDHYAYVCKMTVDGISKVSLDFNIPIGFGVITVDSIEQAIERAGSKAGNKGSDAAIAAIEMTCLKKSILHK